MIIDITKYKKYIQSLFLLGAMVIMVMVSGRGVAIGRINNSFNESRDNRTYLVHDINSGWVAYKDGVIDRDYTGFAYNTYGWWYVNDGEVAFDYDDVAFFDGEWRCVRGGRIDDAYTGMACNEYGWWYFVNGKIDFTYTGMACNEYGWWYYTNGQLDWGYTGMACNEYGWWYYTSGRLDWDYTGMACNEYGWWYYRDGQIDWTYTGIAENENGKWLYQDGRLFFDYNGLYEYKANDWLVIESSKVDDNYTGVIYRGKDHLYMKNGKFAKDYTGLVSMYGYRYYVENGIADYDGMVYYDKTWLYVQKGCVVEDYTGLANNEYGYWYFTNGKLDRSATGMVETEEGDWLYFRNGNVDYHYTGTVYDGELWWYFSDGKRDDSFTGIAENEYGKWYYVDGNIDFSYSGEYRVNETIYTIMNGMVAETRDYNTSLAWEQSLKKMNYDADIVFFGDSITAGSDFATYFDESGKKIVELGLYGDNLANMNERVQMIADVTPDKIFLLAGINELNGENIEWSLKRYNYLLDNIVEACPNASVYIQSVLPISEELTQRCGSNENIKEYNDSLMVIADERNMTYVDLYSLFYKDGYMNPEYTTDGLHLNAAGYTVWGEAIREYVVDV